jgi:hypothetical protein
MRIDGGMGYRGAAFLRLGLSLLMAAYYVLHIPQRAFLWGPIGQLPWPTYVLGHPNAFELYRYSSSGWYAETLFWIALAVAATNATGVLGRAGSVAFALTTYATLERNPFAMDAGQQLLIVASIYLAFADSFAFLSLRTSRRTEWSALLHRAATFSIAAQVCIMYFWAGFYKVAGGVWRDGSALFYVLENQRFLSPGLSHLVYDQPLLVTAATYATIVFQMGFPFLMWNPRTRPLLLAIAVAFHLGIALLMGLVMFSAIMIVVDLALLSDGHLESLAVVVRRAGAIARDAARAVASARLGGRVTSSARPGPRDSR